MLQLEARQRVMEAELDQRRSSEAAPAAAAAVAAASAIKRETRLRAEIAELETRLQAMSAEREAAAKVPRLEARIQQLESRLQAEREAGAQAAQLRATVRQLKEDAQRAERDRAGDRAQFDAFRGGQSRAAAEGHSTVWPVCPHCGSWTLSSSTRDEARCLSQADAVRMQYRRSRGALYQIRGWHCCLRMCSVFREIASLVHWVGDVDHYPMLCRDCRVLTLACRGHQIAGRRSAVK